MWGKKKPTAKEIAKDTKRDIRKEQRSLEREINNLQREEAKVIAEIKKAAKNGDQAGAKVMAKQLVQVRHQKERLYGMKAQIGAVGYQASAVAAQASMASAMEGATKAMSTANKQVSGEKLQKTLMEFARENEKMTMGQEIMEDALIDAFDTEETEAEEEAVVGQVLAEIGLDYGAMMSDAPSHGVGVSSQTAAKAKGQTEEEKLLAELQKL